MLLSLILLKYILIYMMYIIYTLSLYISGLKTYMMQMLIKTGLTPSILDKVYLITRTIKRINGYNLVVEHMSRMPWDPIFCSQQQIKKDKRKLILVKGQTIQWWIVITIPKVIIIFNIYFHCSSYNDIILVLMFVYI